MRKRGDQLCWIIRHANVENTVTPAKENRTMQSIFYPTSTNLGSKNFVVDQFAEIPFRTFLILVLPWQSAAQGRVAEPRPPQHCHWLVPAHCWNTDSVCPRFQHWQRSWKKSGKRNILFKTNKSFTALLPEGEGSNSVGSHHINARGRFYFGWAEQTASF